MSKQMQGNLMLLVTALIWGLSFTAQRKGMEYIGPFTYNSIRFLIGAAVLVPVFKLMDARRAANPDIHPSREEQNRQQHHLRVGGLLCGLALFAGSTLQQLGILYTTAGKSAFITAFYMVLVPVFSVFLGRRIRPVIWLCVVIAVTGMWLLTMRGGLSMGRGELLTLICSLGYAAQILLIDKYSPLVDGVRLSAIQFAVTGLGSIPLMVLFETPHWSQIVSCTVPILYGGIGVCGVAFTFQVLAQKYAEPTVASLIMCLESVFGAIFGALILHETMRPRELCGCIILFAAIILSQLPDEKLPPVLRQRRRT